jgi:NADPH-dependent 2,4-dienoyl-CoA reductase/sulfur reductase-like enzyme
MTPPGPAGAGDPAGRPFVVVGGSLAGLRAVEAARSAGHRGPITFVGAEPHLPYDRPPLSKEFLAPDGEPRFFRTEDHLRDDLGVTLRLGEPATGLDPATRTLRVGDAEIPYGALVIATGSTPRTLPGCAERPGVVTLRTLDDALVVRASLHEGARVVVVGAGFIGSEIASAARARGNDVTVVEAAPVPLVRAAGPVAGAALAALHERHGTDVRLGVGVTGLRGAGDGGPVTAVELSDGSVLPADLVVVGIGSVPATAWLAGSGVARSDADGGVLCDEFLATSVPDVYAAGDVAHWPNAVMDLPLMRLENWSGAQEQGAAAARNALAADPAARTPFETVPYVWSDWYGHRIQFVGHPAADEARLVSGDLDGDRFVVLFRDGDRLAGAVTLNEPGKVMKYRRLIGGRAGWQEALDRFPARAAS